MFVELNGCMAPGSMTWLEGDNGCNNLEEEEEEEDDEEEEEGEIMLYVCVCLEMWRPWHNWPCFWFN